MVSGLNLDIKNQSTNHVFRNPFLDTPFLILCCFSQKYITLGTPSKSSGRQNSPTPASVKYKNVESGQNLSLNGQSGLWFPPLASPGAIPDDRYFTNIFFYLGTPFSRTIKPPRTKLAKIHQNLKKKTQLGHPRLRLCCLFGTTWISNFDQCSWPSNSLKLQ